MKKFFITVLLILSIFVLFNCKKNNKVKTGSNMNERNNYVENLRSHIYEWDLELEKLDAKVQKIEGEVRGKLDEQLSSIRSQRDELNINLKQIQDSTDNDWGKLKKSTENAKDKITIAFSKVQKEFK